MLQFINDLPDDVVGIRATGEVDKDDYERVLIPRMEELAKRQGEINYLLVLETDVQNFTIASWFEDFKLGLKNFSKWNKIAVVTDQASVEWFSDVFSHFIPGESRGYKLSELDEAIAWVSEEEHHEHEEVSVAEVRDTNAARSSNINQGPAGENL
ncbi:MAG: STAS/SEC14 domain-containing protein [Sphingobacteriales bacterium]